MYGSFLKFQCKVIIMMFCQFVAFMILISCECLTMQAYAMVCSDSEIAEMKNAVRQLRIKAPTMSEKNKKEILKSLDDVFLNSGEELANIPKCFLELSKILEEIVVTLNLPESQTKTIRYKIQLIKEWALSTQKLSEGLLPYSVRKERLSSSRSTKVIAEFSGNGSRTTRPFSVSDRWEIQWNYNAGSLMGGIGIFSIDIYDSAGNLVENTAIQQKSGKSSAYRVKGGRYYLNIDAMGDWKIKIVQVN